MNFNETAIEEIAAAALSINGPYIDISNLEKLRKQEMLPSKYSDEPDENFPIVALYIDKETAELVANDRWEISSNVDISIIYKIDPQTENKADSIERGRRCLMQITNKILERQTAGEALTPLYLSGGVQIEANDDRSTDNNETNLANSIATAKFTLKHIKPKENENA